MIILLSLCCWNINSFFLIIHYYSNFSHNRYHTYFVICTFVFSIFHYISQLARLQKNPAPRTCTDCNNYCEFCVLCCSVVNTINWYEIPDKEIFIIIILSCGVKLSETNKFKIKSQIFLNNAIIFINVSLLILIMYYLLDVKYYHGIQQISVLGSIPKILLLNFKSVKYCKLYTFEIDSVCRKKN